jgi:hypothetical protein
MMSEKHAILGIVTLKSKQQLTGAYRHNYRLKEVPNADPAKWHLDKELVEGGDVPYAEVLAQRIATSPYYQAHKVRQNNVLGIELMVTYSPKRDIPAEQWEQENLHWFCERFGKQNVISAMCHYDEHTPHIHAVVIPMLEDGRLGASRMLGGPEGFRQMHDSYAAAMAPFGLIRGIEGSTGKHTKIQKFYGMMNKALDARLPEPEPWESKEEYWMRANEEYQVCHAQALFFKGRCMTLEGQKTGLERQRDRVICELEAEKEKYNQFVKKKGAIISYFETFLAGLKRGLLSREKVQQLRKIIDDIVRRERECREAILEHEKGEEREEDEER